MVPSRVAELAACLSKADRPVPSTRRDTSGSPGYCRRTCPCRAVMTLTLWSNCCMGSAEQRWGLVPGPFPAPRHGLVEEILSDRTGTGVSWSDAILAWLRWEGI
jgi:hypothetical protein